MQPPIKRLKALQPKTYYKPGTLTCGRSTAKALRRQSQRLNKRASSKELLVLLIVKTEAGAALLYRREI